DSGQAAGSRSGRAGIVDQRRAVRGGRRPGTARPAGRAALPVCQHGRGGVSVAAFSPAAGGIAAALVPGRDPGGQLL
ncbi:hypothetical protein DKP78_26345, partial [Enterococcus faecium]